MNKFKEQELISQIDDKITAILTDLRDKQFTNVDSRKELSHLLVKLFLSKDPRSRVAARKVGKFFTELGQELLDMYDEDGNKIIIESKIKRYNSIFKENIITEFENIFKNLFRKHSAKESAGIIKLAIVDAMPDEDYFKNFMRIFK